MALPIIEMHGVSIERREVAGLIDEGVRTTVALRERTVRDRSLRLALNASLGSVNALLSAAASKCTLGGKPADIDLVADGSGDLIYQCHHNPTHRWDLNGHKLP